MINQLSPPGAADVARNIAIALYTQAKPYIFTLGIDEWLEVSVPILQSLTRTVGEREYERGRSDYEKENQ